MVRQVSIETKIRKKKTALIFIILILLFIIFFILLTQTDIFNIKNIEIEGNQKIDNEKILLASGVSLGENIFQLNLSAVRKNLLIHPYIKEAKVFRKIPNKILIKIEEREELIAIAYIGSYVYIDDEGYIVNILSNTNSEIPVVEGMGVKNAIIGEKLTLNDSEVYLSQILEFIKKCKVISLYDNVDILNITNNNINIQLKNGGMVAFGSLNNVEYKLSFLYEILTTLKEENKKFKLVDLQSSEDAIIVTEDN